MLAFGGGVVETLGACLTCRTSISTSHGSGNSTFSVGRKTPFSTTARMVMADPRFAFIFLAEWDPKYSLAVILRAKTWDEIPEGHRNDLIGLGRHATPRLLARLREQYGREPAQFAKGLALVQHIDPKWRESHTDFVA